MCSSLYLLALPGAGAKQYFLGNADLKGFGSIFKDISQRRPQ